MKKGTIGKEITSQCMPINIMLHFLVNNNAPNNQRNKLISLRYFLKK